MAPGRNRRRNQLSSKSKSKQAVYDEKPLKKQKETAENGESTTQELVTENKVIEEEKAAGAKESLPTPAVRKPCTWLKLDRLYPQGESKSSVQNSKQGNEANATGKTQTATDNMRKRKDKNDEKGNNDPKVSKNHIDSCSEKKEKESSNDGQEDGGKRDEETEKKIGGLIFMCNAKTKADCFNYQLMGIPANKKEVVMNIEPGLKLFLYDYDLKLLYGIFEASSAGGMKLEPTAFGGAFPAQVRFAVIKECHPLPESMFKKAIKDSYDERTRKFKTELTVKQVKNLTNMFSPTPWLHPCGRSLDMEGKPMSGPVKAPPALLRNPIHLHPENQFMDCHGSLNAAPPRDPLFLTEQEYRNNGLRQGGPVLPATTGSDTGHALEPSILDRELKQLLRNPASSGSESLPSNPNFPNEKEYRMYGLRVPQQMPNVATPGNRMSNNGIVKDTIDACDPYDESTDALVNRYLAMSRTAAVPADPYPLPGREPYMNEKNQANDLRIHPSGPISEGVRAFASYSLGEQSDFNQRPYSLNSGEPSCPAGKISAPVSHRYSFAGPSSSPQLR